MVHNMGIKRVLRVRAVWAKGFQPLVSLKLIFFFCSEMNYIMFGISITFDVQRRLVYQAI